MAVVIAQSSFIHDGYTAKENSKEGIEAIGCCD